MRAAWTPLLWWANYVSSLVGLVGPWCSWLPGPTLCGGCWLLVNRTGSQSGCLWNPQSPQGLCWLTGGWNQGSENSGAVACH